jgi:hypothetical protein
VAKCRPWIARNLRRRSGISAGNFARAQKISAEKRAAATSREIRVRYEPEFHANERELEISRAKFRSRATIFALALLDAASKFCERVENFSRNFPHVKRTRKFTSDLFEPKFVEDRSVEG